MTVLLTQDATYQYGDNGVLLNDDPSVPFIDVTKVSGLDNTPYQVQDHNLSGQDGGVVIAEWETTRLIVLEGNIYADPMNVETFLDSLKANFAPTRSPQPFYFYYSGISVRVVYCKSLGIKYDHDMLRRTGMCQFQIQLQAEDPTIYDNNVTTKSISLGASEPGRVYPKIYNYVYGSSSSGAGTYVLNNAGNKPGKGILTIYGPVINPVILVDEVGGYLPFGVSLGAGDQLSINLRSKSIVLNGSGNRRYWLQGGAQWFLFQPGTNTIRFQGTAGVGGVPRLDVTFQNSYR